MCQLTHLNQKVVPLPVLLRRLECLTKSLLESGIFGTGFKIKFLAENGSAESFCPHLTRSFSQALE
jgi:hypothetical protein